MKLGALRDRSALEHLLHEVDAPARAVQLVAQHVVGEQDVVGDLRLGHHLDLL